MSHRRTEIYAILEQVKDPEVPVISVVELGIVRDVEIENTPSGERVRVVITPTYSGCPAMHLIEEEVIAALRAAGVYQIEVQMVFNPPWTTDWILESGKRKLKEYGIAPPGRTQSDSLVQLRRKVEVIPCPFCDSSQTKLTSQFSGTACKALYFCHGCQQPFEYFKAF